MTKISEGEIEKFAKSIDCSVINLNEDIKDFECSLQTQEVESVSPFSHLFQYYLKSNGSKC